MKRSELIFNAILVPVDFLMIVIAGTMAYSLRFTPELSNLRPIVFDLPFQRFMEIIFAVAPIFILIFALSGLYSERNVRKFWREVFHIIVGVSAGFMVLIFVTFMQREMFSSRFIFFAGWVFAITMVVIGRLTMRFFQGWITRKLRLGYHRLVLIGKNGIVRSIQKEVKANKVLGYEVVRKFQVCDFAELEETFKDPGIDEIILCSSEISKDRIQELLDFCQEKNIGFKFVPDMFQAQAALFEMQTISDVTLIEVKRTPLDGWGKVLKRISDIIFSSLGLLILSPFFLIIALIIKLDSDGPVFARLDRIAQGRKFKLFKFRSMVKNAHDMKYDGSGNLKPEFAERNLRGGGPLFKIKNDPRVTRFGRFIRRTRLDEFPQLINVFRGEMSLVGPRPHEPEEVAQYKKGHRKLLTIKPGITGMGQVSGSSDLDFEREAKLDIYYIENWSLFLDLIILVKTFFIFLRGDDSAC
ncbi:MAG: sugar transferase [Candidatus Paceibacterota bacterium]|jgi:exopolysaccharide biosynthesis polyprenyl glycosylphosphotransferase